MLEVLLEKIDELRQKLHKLGMEKGIGHPDVLALSQELDQLIIRYYRLPKN